MRWCLPLLFACSTQSDAPPPRQVKPTPAKAVSPAKPARLPGHAGSRQLGEPCGPVATVSFASAWVGARPFDDADPMLHRGPTRVTLTTVDGKIHYSEGVGAAGIEVDLDVDPNYPNYALGKHESTKELRALSLDDKGAGNPSTMVITKIAELAICLDERDRLHVGRRLAASGPGIQAQDEADVVILERER
jgi:hypothetical protein